MSHPSKYESFRDQPWEQRLSKMGDAAEKAFEKVADKGWIRFGLNRPPLDVSALPKRLRYAPDYLMSARFVECQGFGRDKQFKLKREKLDALTWWNTVHVVDLFIWDSVKKKHAFVPISQFLSLIDNGFSTLEYFPEGKAYFSIAGEHFFASG